MTKYQLLLWAALCALLLGVGVARAVDLPPNTPTSLYLPLVSYPDRAPSPHGATYAAWSGPIAIAEGSHAVWVVNPDAGSVSVLHAETHQKLGEVQTGGEPWSLAVSQDGASVFVADRWQGRLLVIDSTSLAVKSSVVVGHEPGGLVLSADNRRAYVSLMTEAAIVVVDTTSLKIVGRIEVAPTPYALAISAHAGNERLLVTHLFGFPIAGTIEAEDDSREGRVTVIDPAALRVIEEIVLPPNERGVANLLASIAVQNGRAWLPHVRASPALPNTMISTVFAAVSTLDLAQNVELPAEALHLNDQEVFGSPVNNPSAAAPSPDGKMLYLVHGGSDLLEVVDVSVAEQPRLVRFLATGKNPRGIVLSADGKVAYVMNHLSRSVSVYNLEQLALITEVGVTQETLAPDVLAGKILFHNATDPRLSRGGWISCASCHFEGWPDGVTWIFPDGPRQSPMFWNAAETLPWHWSATLDEAQDVEETIHLIQIGLGLTIDQDPPLLGKPLAGQSDALDNLSAYLLQGIRPVQVAAPQDVSAGRSLFASQGCNNCHGGPTWTISALPGLPGTLDPDGDGMINSVLRDVGTDTERDLRGKGGFDVPSLLGVGLTAPYFHDGSAPNLEDLLRSGHPDPQGSMPPLEAAQLGELLNFLRSIGPDTHPVSVP